MLIGLHMIGCEAGLFIVEGVAKLSIVKGVGVLSGLLTGLTVDTVQGFLK